MPGYCCWCFWANISFFYLEKWRVECEAQQGKMKKLPKVKWRSNQTQKKVEAQQRQDEEDEELNWNE